MTPRENFLSLYRRQGYEVAPVGMHLCPAQEQEFARRHPEAGGDYLSFFGAPYRIVYDPGFAWNFDEMWRIPGRGRDGGRRAETGGQRSEDGDRRAEVGGRRTEVGGRRSGRDGRNRGRLEAVLPGRLYA